MNHVSEAWATFEQAGDKAMKVLRYLSDRTKFISDEDPKTHTYDDKEKIRKYLHRSRRRFNDMSLLYAHSGLTNNESYTFRHRTRFEAINGIFSFRPLADIRHQIWLTSHHDSRAGYGIIDNGTGCAINYAVAQELRDTPAADHLVIASFDVEEAGCAGSNKHIGRTPIQHLNRIKALVNVDCIGSGDTIGVVLKDARGNHDPGLAEALQAVSSVGGLPWASVYKGAGSSDHAPFSSTGVPATQVVSYTHCPKADRPYIPYIHSYKDWLNNVDPQQVEEVIRVLCNFILVWCATADGNARRATKRQS